MKAHATSHQGYDRCYIRETTLLLDTKLYKVLINYWYPEEKTRNSISFLDDKFVTSKPFFNVKAVPDQAIQREKRFIS